jgi:hypothetical protein
MLIPSDDEKRDVLSLVIRRFDRNSLFGTVSILGRKLCVKAV